MLVAALAACSSAPPRTASDPTPVLQARTPDAAPPEAAPPIDAPVHDEPPPLVPEPRGRVVVTVSDPCGFILDQVYFEKGSAVPPPWSKPVIDATADMLVCLVKQGDHRMFEVQGNTDDREADALTLSDSRAQVIAAELVKRGVPRDILIPVGYGATQPIDRRNTEQARAKNRRVAFLVLPPRSP